MFESARKNKFKTAVIVTLIFIFVTVAVYFISYAFGYGQYAIALAGVVSIALSVGGYWFSDRIVLSLNRARPATEEQDRQLRNILEGLCIASGLPMPKLYVVEDPAPNAFATGRNPKNSVVCVTTGLLQMMDYYQLEGVIAHEMAHIKNYDILLQTVASVLIGFVLILSHFFTRMLWFGGGRRRGGRDGGGNAIFMLIGLVFVILAPIAGQLLKMALSRNREYLADATGVEFTRNPEGLASALEKLGGIQIPMRSANSATEGLYIVTPLQAEKKKEKESWFSTHPPIAKRVEALRNIR